MSGQRDTWILFERRNNWRHARRHSFEIRERALQIPDENGITVSDRWTPSVPSLSIKSRQCSCSFLFHWSSCSFRRYRRRRTHTTRRQQLPPRRRRASRVSGASVASAVPDNWDTGIRPNLIPRQRHKCKLVAFFRACRDTPMDSSPDINRHNIWGELLRRARDTFPFPESEVFHDQVLNNRTSRVGYECIISPSSFSRYLPYATDKIAR